MRESSSPRQKNEPLGMSRRGLLVGLGSAGALSFSLGANARRILAALSSPMEDENQEKSNTTDASKNASQPAPQEITPDQKRQTWETLKLKFPELAKQPFRIFSMHDEDVYLFLEICSLQDFMELGIINGKEGFFEFFDTPKLWRRACAMNRQRNSYRDAVAKAPDETLTLGRLLGETKHAMETLRQDILPQAELANGFGKYLDPELMVAIFIQEIGPGGGNKKQPMTPKGRLELTRMMLDNGWQAQKTPALGDAAISFGLGQMTLQTHKGLQRAYHDETDGFVEPDLMHHTSATQQIRNSLLLAFANLQSFSEIAEKHPHFVHAFHKSTDDRRGRFLAPIIAAYHNYGGRMDLKNRIARVLKKKLGTLEDYRTAFLAAIANLPIASSHAQNSSAIYTALKTRASRIPMEDMAGDPMPDEEEIPPPENLPITEEMLTVNIKKHPKTGERMSYYTFAAAQGVRTETLLQYILREGKTTEDVQIFQDATNAESDGSVQIPLSYLPQELRNRRFARIAALEKKPMELIELYLEGGASPKNRALAILYGTTWQELRVPSGLLKENVSLEIPPNLAWLFPTDGQVTQGYHGITDKYEDTHYAWDIGQQSKPEVWAAADGMVVKVVKGCKPRGEKKQPEWCKAERTYGNYVDVAHGGDRFTRYAHLERVDVTEGQRVKAGMTLGKMGNTGSSRGKTGVHCHFELWDGGQKIDPSTIFLGIKKAFVTM